MIYRKKILLALVELFGGELSATDFQKLLFILSQEQIDNKFEFIPYKYGCFSFQAMADKNKLINEGYLEHSNNWRATSKNTNFITALNEPDRKLLQELKNKFGNCSTAELIRHVYKNYPYFAINSEIASKYSSVEELEVIDKLRPTQKNMCLFTIGYEGRSLERYLNTLILSNIKVLCDVRKNPMSRKYGFAKRTLQNACETVNIKYLHLPELGIVSEKRKSLKSQADYDKLFIEYEKTVLPVEKRAVKFIHSLLLTFSRVALTCYEALPDQCHRTRVANAVHSIEETIPLKHL
jgi:uncharacterized protein (DUF488 family)